MRQEPDERLIVALDVEGLPRARELVGLLKDRVRTFKVGSRLFTREGPNVVEMIRRQSGRVFLDLKFHDIPSVVAEAAREAVNIGAFMLTLHALGGRKMLQEAMEAANEEALRRSLEKPILLGVTVLSSFDETSLRETLSTPLSLQEQVLALMRLVKESGLDGVVVSPQEVAPIRAIVGKSLMVVAAGVRPLGSRRDDQKRALTPKEAVEKGADFIVVGRPIIQAPDPLAATERILAEIGQD